MKRVKITIFFLLILMKISAQDSSDWWGNGNITITSNIQQYPVYNDQYHDFQYSFMFNQQIQIDKFPFLFSGTYTDISNNTNHNLNTLHFSYDACKFKQNIVNNANKIYEKKYFNEISKKQNINHFLRNKTELESLINNFDEELLYDEINRYKTFQLTEKNKDSLEKYTRIIDELEERKSAWEQLKRIKNKQDSLLATTSYNDSLIKHYLPYKIKDYNNNRTFFNNINSLNKAEKIIASVEQFNIGRFFLLKHPFVSQNALIDGVELKIQPADFNIYTLYGKLNTFNNLSLYDYNNVNIAGISMGIVGKNNTSELSGFKLFNHQNDINFLMSFQQHIALAKNIYMDWICAGSQYNMQNSFDYYLQSSPIEYSYEPNNFIYNILFQRKSFNFITGYAIDAKLNFDEIIIKNNQLFFTYNYISPTYFSTTSPFLIKDIYSLSVGTSQMLAKNKLRFTLQQRFRYKDKTELYNYKATWLNTSIETKYVPQKNLMLYGQYQYFYRNRSNYHVLIHWLNLNATYTINKLFGTIHSFQTNLSEYKNGIINYNMLYSMQIPFNYLNLGIGYGKIFQNDMKGNYIKTNISFNIKKKVFNDIFAYGSIDNIVKKYQYGYNMMIKCNEHFVIEQMISYRYIDFIYDSYISIKNGFTYNIKLNILW